MAVSTARSAPTPQHTAALREAVCNAPGSLPASVYANLVGLLYASRSSLVNGAATGAVCGALAWYWTGSLAVAAAALAVFVVGLTRVALQVAYVRRAGSLGSIRTWERLYGVGAVAYAFSLGMMCVAGILFTDVGAVHMMVVSVTIGYTAGITGRNAGLTHIVVPQILGATAPLSAVLLYEGYTGQTLYGVLGAMLVLFFVSMRDVASTLNSLMVRAFVSTDRLSLALTNMSPGLAMFDAEGRVTLINARFSEHYGLVQDAFGVGDTLRGLIEACRDAGKVRQEDVNAFSDSFAQRLAAPGKEEVTMELLDGRTLNLTFCRAEHKGAVVLVEDITQRVESERQISHMARFDSLTSLPNRWTFRHAMDKFLNEGRRFGVLSVDLDNFKDVNDTLGHPVGDSLLAEVATRLKATVGPLDIVARFGGDEFVILQENVTGRHEPGELAQRIISALGEPYELGGHRMLIGASVGIAMAPLDSDDADLLLKNADMGLYAAKSQGRGTYRFFEAEMDASAQARRRLELDLESAIKNGEFEIHYQPQLNLGQSRISACEALVRWRHPERGMIPPDKFIRVAEETGRIVEIGGIVLRRACLDAMTWGNEVRVAVNVSAVQFRRPGLVAAVRAALAESGLPANRLELEITESLFVDAASCIGMIHELTRLGVHISLDDFGTGYSSMSYLSKFPFHKVKIDRSFVRDLGNDLCNKAIVKAVSGLCADLSMSLTVEGVETPEQLEILRGLGTTDIQGYYFSRPVTNDRILAMLEKQAGHARLTLPLAA